MTPQEKLLKVDTCFCNITGCHCRIFFSVSKAEWIWLIIAIVIVWVAEALNTAFELLCDVTSPEFHPIVKKSKDVAAGSVLISAIGSIIIGALVFLPRIYNLLNVNIKL